MSPANRQSGNPKAFFKQVKRLVDLAGSGFEAKAEAQPDKQTYYLAACLPVQGVGPELARLEKAAAENPKVAEPLTAVLKETGGATLMSTMAAKSPSRGGDAPDTPSLEEGLDLGADILAKASGYLPPPFDGVADNVGQILGIIGKLSAEDPPDLESLIQAVQTEVQKIEMKAERLGTLTGHAVVNDAGEVVGAPPNDGYGPSAIPGSLLWMVWQNQFKLEHMWRKAFGQDIPVGGDDWVRRPPDAGSGSIADRWFNNNGGQFGLLAYKIDKLAELLGQAIVDSKARWDPEPDLRPLSTTQPPPEYNMLPKKSVKEELHDIEDLLKGLQKLLKLVVNIDILNIDIDIDVDIVNIFKKYVSLSIEDLPLKRIYVYDEGVFQAQNARAIHRVPVRTKAFDLAGWIDLDDMKVGDVVRVDIYVLLPVGTGGRRKRRFYRRKIFRGTGSGAGSAPGSRARRSLTGRGLHSLQDICGPTILVGNAIDIDIRQEASASGYPSSLGIGYQFVVESRDSGPPTGP